MRKKKGATRLNPCHGCPIKKGCEDHPKWVAKISGLGLRAVTFECPRLLTEIRVGRRVEVNAPFAISGPDGPEYDGIEIRNKPVRATVVAVDPLGRFNAVIDRGQLDEPGEDDKFRFRRRAGAYRVLRFLDEPDARICDLGQVKLAGAPTCQGRPSAYQNADKPAQCQCEYMAELSIPTDARGNP